MGLANFFLSLGFEEFTLKVRTDEQCHRFLKAEKIIVLF